jgi:hypothetical protein
LDVSLIWFLQFDDSAIVEECLVTIAARQPTTRFLSGSDSNEAFLDDSAVIKLQKPN